jgi:hypothetical protein
MVSESKAKQAERLTPLEEPQDKSVSLKLGATHYQWLQGWSRKRLGVINISGILRLVIQEKWESENGKQADLGRTDSE